MIANNGIYLNILQISSALHMYSLAYLPEIFPLPSFLVASLCSPFSVLSLFWHSCWASQAIAEFSSAWPHPLHCSCFEIPHGSRSRPKRGVIPSLFCCKDCQITFLEFSFIPGILTGETTVLFRENPHCFQEGKIFVLLSPRKQ